MLGVVPRWRPQRPSRRHRATVVVRRTATSRQLGRDQRRLWSSSSRHRRHAWAFPYWWSWFRSLSHRLTRPRSPRPPLRRQPRFWSRTAAPAVAWVTCKRSGEPPDPGTKNVNAFPFSIAHDSNAPETHLPVPSPLASAGTGRSFSAPSMVRDWSPLDARHDRINSGDPHISRRYFASIPGDWLRLPASISSPSW